MEEENGIKESPGSLEAQKSNGEEEPDIGSKRASNSETIIYEASVARYGSKVEAQKSDGDEEPDIGS